MTNLDNFNIDGRTFPLNMHDYTNTSPGDLLRSYREVRGMTQKTLATLSFCSVMMIRKIEGGIRRPSHDLAHKLADALNVLADQRDEFVRLMRHLPELPN
jgi:transcriptional regulator with XRE-family HTH domain